MKDYTAFFSKKLTICIGAVICNALWGSAFPCIKTGYELFQIASDDKYGQIVFAGIRFTLAGILTVLIGSVLNQRVLTVKRENYPVVTKLAMLQTVIQYVFFYLGLANTTGVKSSILNSVNVFVALLISSLIFRMEHLDKKKILGCVLGFLGVILINLGDGGFGGGFQLTGEGFILLATVSYGFSTVMMKRYSNRELPIALSGYQFVVGGVIMVLAGVLLGGRLHVSFVDVGMQGILLLFYLAFISAVAYSLWGTLLKYNPVSRVAIYGFLNPIFGVLLSAVILGESWESFGVKGIVALVLVCAGIFVTNWKKE